MANWEKMMNRFGKHPEDRRIESDLNRHLAEMDEADTWDEAVATEARALMKQGKDHDTFELNNFWESFQEISTVDMEAICKAFRTANQDSSVSSSMVAFALLNTAIDNHRRTAAQVAAELLVEGRDKNDERTHNRKDYEFARHAPKGGYWEHETAEVNWGDRLVFLFCMTVLTCWAFGSLIQFLGES